MRIGIVVLVLISLLSAQDEVNEEIKHRLRPNMEHLYYEVPGDVENIGDMFTQGKFYGRFRFNSFGFKWKEELQSSTGKYLRKDHAIMAIGGSLIYKSAYLNGFGVGAGLYVTEALGTLPKNEAYLYKAGKGVLSRYDQLTDGDDGILSLAQAYLEYKYEKTRVKGGRQIFESFLTKSNDTKMIPNTFEGVTLVTKEIPQTVFKAAYLTGQKLRDHSEFHHVLAYGYVSGAPADAYTQYTENDDASMHIGLTLEALNAAGIDDRLVIFDAKNKSIENLTLFANYTTVPELLSYAMIQADYKFEAGAWTLIPGLRYMRQFDEGAGDVIGKDGASRRLIAVNYNDPNSLDAELFGARLDVVQHDIKLRFGYTKVADKADIIAPWRGFPTAGFTRAMSQYNWYANTKSYMMQVNFFQNNIMHLGNIVIFGRYVYQDFDDEKPGVQADSQVVTLDLMKGFGGESNMYLKLRYGHVWGDEDTPIAGTTDLFKADPSYDELRLELNYLF